MTEADELANRLKKLDPEIFDVKFEDLADMVEIGGGNFGQVMKAHYIGVDVAVKKMLDVDDPDMHKYIKREMATLRSMPHPNVVQFMGLCRNENDIFMVTEYVPGGDLRHRLKSDATLSWSRKIQIALDVCTAMTFLHSRGIIHRDLKSNNLLVGAGGKIKVCDFGFSRKVKQDEIMTLCGTDEWMAPEVMVGEAYDGSADVFSFGIVMTEIITRDKPVIRVPARMYAFDEKKFRDSLPKGCPSAFCQIAIDCAKHTPADRPTFKVVMTRLKACLEEYKAKRAERKKKKKEKSSKSSSSSSSSSSSKPKRTSSKKSVERTPKEATKAE